MQYIRRQQINFGKTDAKSAIINRDPSVKQLFLDAFAPPKAEDIDSIRSGDRYIFFGSKGSGKTALLRYMMELEARDGNVVKALVFSEDVTTQDKEKIVNSADFENFDAPEISDILDVKDMWRIFLIQKIITLICSNKDMFDDGSDAEKLGKIVSSVFDDNKLGTLDRIISGIRSGTLRISSKLGDFAELEGMLNWERNSNENKINYSRFSEILLDKLCKLNYPNDVKYIYYIDEINLAMLGQEQHKKDSILIRDLIITVGYLNRVFVEKGIPIYLYAAVRVEIARAVNISRSEIDKYLIDHGYKLEWHGQYAVDKYPIFSIIENRIIALEKLNSKNVSKNSDVWENYFSRDIYGVNPKKFISEITWCNPRDIVNLFNLASKASPSLARYDTHVFSQTLDQYSDIVWTERAEELNAEHNMTVVKVMKTLLSSWFKHFKINQLDIRMVDMGPAKPMIAQISKTLGAERICRDLYYVGVLGQSIPSKIYTDEDGRNRREINETWFYRDNREFDPSQWMVVHKALYPTLKITPSLRAQDFGNDKRFE